jgi:hypothetical protein
MRCWCLYDHGDKMDAEVIWWRVCTLWGRWI